MGSRTAVLPSRRLLAFLLVLPLALLALLVAPPSADAASEMWRLRSKGTVVDGFASSFDGCVSTFTAVFATDRSVEYFSASFDECTGAETFVSGFAEPSVFSVSKNLSSAHVVATIPVFDGFTGEQVDTIDLDNTWTATGRAVRVKSSFSASLPGSFRFSSRFHGTSAPAVVTGTVPLDEGSIGKFSQMEASFSRS